jgi:hypothetical protein
VEKVNLVIEKSIKAAIAKTLESGVGWEEIIIIDKDVKTLCEKVGFLKKNIIFLELLMNQAGKMTGSEIHHVNEKNIM